MTHLFFCPTLHPMTARRKPAFVAAQTNLTHIGWTLERSGEKGAMDVYLMPLAGFDREGFAAAGAASLSVGEQRRAATFARAEQRFAYVASHVLLRRAAERVLGRDAGDYGEDANGRPGFARLSHLSLSRSNLVVAVAASPQLACGVDVERISARAILPDWRNRSPSLARLVPAGAREELAFILAWTRAEAIAKLTQVPLGDILGEGPLATPVLTSRVIDGLGVGQVVVSLACAVPCRLRFQKVSVGAGLDLSFSDISVPSDTANRSSI